MAQLQRAHAGACGHARARRAGSLVYATCSLEPEEGRAADRPRSWRRIPISRAQPIAAAEIGAEPEWISADGDLRTLTFHGAQSPPGACGRGRLLRGAAAPAVLTVADSCLSTHPACARGSAAWLRCRTKLSEPHGEPSPTGLESAPSRTAAPFAGLRHRPRAGRSRRCWRGAGAAAGRSPACAARGCCAGATGREAADELLLAPPDLRVARRQLRRRGGLGQLRARRLRSPRSGDARRSPSRRRARNGHASCTASAGCATSTHAQTQDARALAQQLVGEWIRRSRRARRPRLGARGRRAPPHLLAVARGAAARWRRRPALRRRHASLTDHATYLSASWRNAPDGYPRLLCPDRARLRRPVHQRPRAPAGAVARSCWPRSWNGRLRPTAAISAATPALLIELLLDLLPLRQCLRGAQRQPRRRPRSARARGHRAHDGDAAPPAARRRHARALQRHGRDRARRACHRADLRRQRGGGRPRRDGYVRLERGPPGGDRRCRSRPAAGAGGAGLRGLPLLRAQHRARAAARQRRHAGCPPRRRAARSRAPPPATTRSASASSPPPG